MLRRYLFFVIFLSIAFISLGQDGNQRLAINFDLTTKTGWWIFHRGNPPNVINQGWDRTHYNIKMNAGIGITFKINRITTKIFFQPSVFFEDEMLQLEDYIPQRRKYDIADRAVTFIEYGFGLGYDMVQSRKYALAPILEVGFFTINTTHPERDFFDQQYFWQIGIQNRIRKNNISWVLTPLYQEMTITSNNTNVEGSFHKIHNFGLNMGMLLWIR